MAVCLKMLLRCHPNQNKHQDKTLMTYYCFQTVTGKIFAKKRKIPQSQKGFE